MSTVRAGRPFRGLGRMLAALVRQRRRLALATVAIALGVGYLAGALTLLDRVAGGLDALAAAGAERSDLVVEGGVAYESPLEQVRRLVPITVGQGLDEIPGVDTASPRIEDVAVLIGRNGTPLVAPGLSEQPLGANWPDDSSIAPYRFADGGPPQTADDVVIDQRSAQRAGVGVGDKIAVTGKAKAADYTVSGIIRTEAGGLPAGSSLALFTTSEARALFDRPLDDNAVAVRLAPGADRAEVEGAIRRTLPPGIDVVDGPTAAVHRQESLTRSFTLVRSLIIGFAALALVVGMVTVANSLALLYGERRRTFAALRLVGAKPHQLMTAALIEAGMLALVASLIGAPLGLLLGRLIEAALGALNTSVPVAGSMVSWPALGWAVLIGTVATVIAAVFPAARACRVPPIEAVTDAAVQPQRRLGQSLLVVAAVAVVAGVGAALLVLQGGGGGSAATAGAMVGAAVAFVGLLPVILSSLVAGGVRLVPVRPRALRRIAARDVVRNRTRTAATAAALILATAVVSGLAVFLASFTASIDGEVKQLVTADLVVDSGTFTRGGLPADLLDQVAGLPDVQATSGWQVGRATVGLTPLRLTGLDLDSFYDMLSPVWVGTPPASLDPSSILLSSDTATALGVRVGDALPVTFTSGGTEGLRVAGIYDSGTLLLGEAVLDRSVLQRQIPATTDIAALVTLDPDNAAARAAVKDVASSYGITSVLQPDKFVDRRSDLLRGFQRVIEWMLLFTLVQALVGVVNTLLLSVGERRREFGLLRASGASRRQVLRLVLLEGISLAVVGTAFGLGLGILGARLGLAALASLGLQSFVIPVGSVILTGVAAVLLGVAAAVIPARWAAGVPPLEAVSDAGMLRTRPRRTQRPRLYRRGRASFHWEKLVPVPAAVPMSRPAPMPPPMAPPMPRVASVRAPMPPPMAPPMPAPVAPAPALSLHEAARMPVRRIGSPSPEFLVLPPPVEPVPPTVLHVGEAPAMPAPGVTPVAPVPVTPPLTMPAYPSLFGRDIAAPAGTWSTAGSTADTGSWAETGTWSDAAVWSATDVPVQAEPVPQSVPVPEPEPVVAAAPVPEPERVVAAAPVPEPERVVAAAPVPEPEPVVAAAPEPVVVPDVAVPGPRRRRVSRLVADSTRRRRDRSEPGTVGAADGWLTPDAEPVAASVAAPVQEPVAFRPGPVAEEAGGLRFGTSSPTPPRSSGPPRPPGGPGGGPTGPGAPREGRDGAPGPGDGLGEAVGHLQRESVEDGAPALAILGGVLAPGERVEHLVQGWAKGIVCIVARTERRVIVVADRRGRPLVESLHPTRTTVSVMAGTGGPVRMAVSDGRRVLEVSGIRDTDQATALARPGRPDPGYF